MTVAAELIDRARQADILETARSLGAVLKPVAGRIEFAGGCPTCGGTDRFSVNTKKQVWHCRGCGKGGDVVDLVQHVEGVTFIKAVETLAGESPTLERPPPPAGSKARKLATDEELRNRKITARIVAGLVPVAGTPGEQYLREIRKIDTDAVVDVLERVDAIGWHPAVYFNEPGHPLHERNLGAIIGIMSDPVTAAPTSAISRTYLDPDGMKVGKAKTLGAPAGIVRLSPDEAVEGGLHLCEGLETGLSAMSLGFRPLWATGSTSLMRVFPVLGGIETVTFLADRDANEAGEEAAKEAARRWRAVGREARIKRLNQGLGDINDALRRAR